MKTYMDYFFFIMTSNTVHTTQLSAEVVNGAGVTGGAGFCFAAGSGCQCMRDLRRVEDL